MFQIKNMSNFRPLEVVGFRGGGGGGFGGGDSGGGGGGDGGGINLSINVIN